MPEEATTTCRMVLEQDGRKEGRKEGKELKNNVDNLTFV
jgi:hypothetical protein